MMLNRREFLGAAAAVTALSVTGATRADRDAISDDAPDLAPTELLAALGPEAVREIGSRYRAMVPAERNRPTLEAVLRTELRARRAWNDDPVRADFEAGRVVVVGNWMLSRTEARRCALFSLRSP